MNNVDGLNLDLNLLRTLVEVADTGSVTRAASRLYLTQPAVSAALSRLRAQLGVPLFTRVGRGLALTQRGCDLVERVRPLLAALVSATLAPPAFEPKTSEATVRIGLSDATETSLLAPLVKVLRQEAPHMRIAARTVQFRTVEDALLRGDIDLAVTVADELAPSIRRKPLVMGSFVCVCDPAHVSFRMTRMNSVLRERDYFASDHVIVSYNGDFRGVVEDALSKTRRVRCSVDSFAHVGAIVSGTNLLATVPTLVANDLLALRPHLRALELPFSLQGTPMELLWPASKDDDEAANEEGEEAAAEARHAQAHAARP